MKTVRIILLAVLLGVPAVRGGIIFTNLFSFKSLYDSNGLNPAAGLVQGSDGNFYGTTSGGLYAGYDGRGPPKIRGTIFRITQQGAFTTLATLDKTNGDAPHAALVQGRDGNFYGTTILGGELGYGTVFQVTTNGMLKTLVSFNGLTGVCGWWPEAGLVQGDDSKFYGAAYRGGPWNLGTIFSVTMKGVVTELVAFNGTNGSYPRGKLVQAKNGDFYGTTTYGGANKGKSPPDDAGYGTVFRITTNGELNTLVSFNGSNGSHPYAGLVLGNSGNFYGTTRWGGAYGKGTVFQMIPDGTLTTMFSFNGTNGAWPDATLLQGSDGAFYGTTETGGIGYNGTPAYGNGTVFRVSTKGFLTTLISFNGTNGVNPHGALIQSRDGNFYGTTAYGGVNRAGTIFRFTMTP